MTDEEMGRKLAEACGFAYQGEWYYTGWDDLTGGATHSLVVDLATSVDAIIRDVFPVLDERLAWQLDMVRISSWETDPDWVAIYVWDHGQIMDEADHLVTKSASTLARTLAEACLAALTEVTA